MIQFLVVMPTLIDTREAFRRLREQGGFSDEQADAIVDIFTDIDEQVATRGDIEQLRSDLEGNIKQLRSDTKSDTDQLRTEMEKLRTDMEAMEDRLPKNAEESRLDHPHSRCVRCGRWSGARRHHPPGDLSDWITPASTRTAGCMDEGTHGSA